MTNATFAIIVVVPFVILITLWFFIARETASPTVTNREEAVKTVAESNNRTNRRRNRGEPSEQDDREDES